jgi:hypothetical protein
LGVAVRAKSGLVGGDEVSTVNTDALVAEPELVVTVIGPVVAFDGTVVRICVADAEVTGAMTPLKEIVF